MPNAVAEVGKKLDATAALQYSMLNPVWFAERFLGVKLHAKQRELLNAVRDNPYVACRSCNGIGKTLDAVIAGVWFTLIHPHESLVLVTANTWEQIESVYFEQLYKLWVSAPFPLSPTPPTKASWMLEAGWGIRGKNSDKPDSIKGEHAKFVMLIADEAFGIPAVVFDTFEGSFSNAGPDNVRRLLIGNPTDQMSFAGKCFAPGSRWKQIQMSAMDSPNITGEFKCASLPTQQWVDEKREQWGENSNQFRVSVLGEFPVEGAIDRVIPENVLQKAIGHVPQLPLINGFPRHSTVQGLDVARYGDDATVSAIIRDGMVSDIRAWHGLSSVQVATVAAERARQFEALVTVVDETGLGGGVVDQLIAAKSNVWPVNYAEKPLNGDRYGDVRTELSFVVAEALRIGTLGLDAVLPVEALDDLRALCYGVPRNGRLMLEAKEDTKKRLGRSPCRADAITLAWRGYSNPGGRFATPGEQANRELQAGIARLTGHRRDYPKGL